MDDEMKFADGVWHRVVQIVQESILMGVDCSDLLRQIRVVQDPSNEGTLVLSPAYERQVREMHEKMLKQARDAQASAQKGNKFIIPGGSGGSN